MQGIIPNLQAKYIFLENGRVMYWLAQNCKNQISVGVLAGQTPPSLISFCSLGKQKELTKITQPALERHRAQQLQGIRRAESIIQMSRAHANINFMGLFSWMLCVSMLKISNVFQLFYNITWIAIFVVFFNVKRTQKNLEKRSVAHV